MEDDDEIEREVDVFVAPSLASTLHLVQFPLQHGDVPLPKDARIKPRHGLVELDQALPANIGMEGAFFLSQRTLKSQTIPVSTHMALCRLRPPSTTTLTPSTLQMIPLEHVVQMRPSFAHVDEQAGIHASEECTPAPTAAATPAKAKPLMFQKKESERASQARQNSYAFKKASEDSEEWTVLQVYGEGTDEYDTVLDEINNQSSTTTSSEEETSMSVQQQHRFVQSLNYLPNGDGDENQMVTELAENLPGDDYHSRPPLPGGVSLAKVVQKVVGLLHEGWPIPYDVIRLQFPTDVVDDRTLLTALGTCCVLVRGNFCLQSKFVALPSRSIMNARNFLLYLFQTYGFVGRTQLDQVISAPLEEYSRNRNTTMTVSQEWIQVLLLQIGKRAPNGWVLKLEDNNDFCVRFTDTTSIHQQYWERQKSRWQRELELYNRNPDDKMLTDDD